MFVSINPIEPGDAASPNLWNDRFGAITEVLNGNVDSDNIKDGGVTNSKLADGAVTSNKIATSVYVDANGWTVRDLGTFKMYTRTSTATNVALNEGQRHAIQNVEPPVGRTRDNIVIVGQWYGGYAGHAIVGFEGTGASLIQIIIAHNWPAALTMNGLVHLIAFEKV